MEDMGVVFGNDRIRQKLLPKITRCFGTLLPQEGILAQVRDIPGVAQAPVQPALQHPAIGFCSDCWQYGIFMASEP
jgi:hypothetical protein